MKKNKFKNIRKKQIKDLFNDFKNRLILGIWFSGIEKEGKFFNTWTNGNIYVEGYLKNYKWIKEYKVYWSNKQLAQRCYFDPNNPNKLVGLYIVYSESGKIIQKINFLKHEIQIIKNSDNGFYFPIYIKNKRTGKFISFKEYAKKFNLKIVKK